MADTYAENAHQTISYDGSALIGGGVSNGENSSGPYNYGGSSGGDSSGGYIPNLSCYPSYTGWWPNYTYYNTYNVPVFELHQIGGDIYRINTSTGETWKLQWGKWKKVQE